MNDYAPPMSAAAASPQVRTDFLHRTYQHLGGAIAAFIGLEFLLFQIPGIEKVVFAMLGGVSWLIVLGAFMLVSRVAESWAHNAVDPSKQYMGLGLFVVAEALVFLPLLYVAAFYAGPDVIPNAAVTTGVIFGGLTMMVMFTKKDFSFLGGILRVVGLAALAYIVAGLIFGFSFGLVFSVLMAAFAAGAIVYQTSNVLHHYRPDQHVAAALGLFSAVGLLFWYILQIFMSRD